MLSFAFIHRRLVELRDEQRKDVGRFRCRCISRLVERVVRDLPILLGFTHCRFCVDAVGCLALHSNRAGLVDLGYQ